MTDLSELPSATSALDGVVDDARARFDAAVDGTALENEKARFLGRTGAITERLDPETLSFGAPPDRLQINDIAHVGLRTADPMPVDDYADVRATGSFLLIDPPTGNTLAAGLVGEPLADALRRSTRESARSTA